MKVWVDEDGHKRLVGRADVPETTGAVFEVPLFGAVSTIVESYVMGTVTRFPEDDGPPIVERGVILSRGQHPELLPGWTPLAS